MGTRGEIARCRISGRTSVGSDSKMDGISVSLWYLEGLEVLRGREFMDFNMQSMAFCWSSEWMFVLLSTLQSFTIWISHSLPYKNRSHHRPLLHAGQSGQKRALTLQEVYKCRNSIATPSSGPVAPGYCTSSLSQ